MELIIETQEEEMTDIERIMHEYGDSLLRMCTIYLKDRQLAEDVVQETFIKVYQKYHTFNHTSEEKTWIMRIAINTCKNYMRTSWFSRVVPGMNLETISATGVEGEIIKQEEQRQLLSEVIQLNYKYKEVILLHYYEEMPTKEIAKVLGIKDSTVRVRLKRARQQLSVNLKEVKDYETRL